MKALWIAVGTVWFGGWTVCSYHFFASSRPVPVEIESESPLPPVQGSSPSRSRPPRRTFSPHELLGGVPPTPQPPRKQSRRASPLTDRHVDPPSAVAPLPLLSGGKLKTTDEPAATSQRRGICLLCAEPAYSWVEREGQRYGYCLKHQGQPDASATARVGSGNASKRQCLGTTKSGAQCRRMTTDLSGYCYQHQRL